MEKYGLQRGERGSEARHVTTAQYYRNIQREKKDIESEVQQLRQEKQETQVQLVQAKRDIQIDKLKGKALEQENTRLYQEVATRDESIQNLQTNLQRMQEQHRTELLNIQVEHHKEVSRLNRIIQKAFTWIPLLKELFRMEKMCRLIGFTAEQTATLVVGTPLEYSGEFHSEEHKRSFTADRVLVQVGTEPKDRNKLFLSINRININDWFKERLDTNQSEQMRQKQKKNKGLKI